MRSGCEHVYMYLPVDVTINKKNPTYSSWKYTTTKLNTLKNEINSIT